MSDGERSNDGVLADPAFAKTQADIRGVEGVRGDSSVLATGERIGRFRVEGTLGQGAMGVVLAAHDPELDRRVALKLLQVTAWRGGTSSHGRERLLREAQAMANLSHPNVLTIYDVGTVGDEVFVAMELAAGGTLRQWWEREPRPWRVVIARFLEAARGLDAAHRAGLVHRDFKPDNVLITADDQVRVADFGLVGVRGARAELDPEKTPIPISLSSTLTQDGVVLGTPAYMAPEQHMRGTVGPAADQFAFCVSLYEALYGERPFTASLPKLADAVIAGRLRKLPTETAVPRWVLDVLVRGLSASPDQRWPSMTALIEALSTDPAAAKRRRRRQAAVGATVVGLAALAAFGLLRPAEMSSRCRTANDHLEGVWDEGRRQSMRRAMLATGRAYAGDTFERVAARLDTYTRQWVSARDDACRATHDRGEQSSALLDLRMRCYDRRLQELAGLTELFAAGPDVDVLDRAVRATLSLSPLDTCANVEALQASVPLPADPQVRARVKLLQDRLERAKAMADAGKRDAALVALEAIRKRADETGYLPLRARAQFQYARGLEHSSQRTSAQALVGQYERAARLAARAGEDDIVALAWIQTIWIKGYPSRQHKAALALRTTAEVAVARAGNDPKIEARLLNAIGTIYDEIARHEEAQKLFSRTLELRRKAFGAEHPEVAAALNNLADSYQRSGEYQQAYDLHKRSLEMKVKLLGPVHPDVTASLYNLGVTSHSLGNYDEAIAYYERSEKLFLQQLKRIPCTLIAARAEVRVSERRLDEAVALYQRAVEACEVQAGPRGHLTAEALHGLGHARHLRGELEAAIATHKRALAIREAVLGSDHFHTGLSTSALGAALLERGLVEKARPLLERGVRILKASALGPGNPYTASAQISLAELLTRTGQLRPAAAKLNAVLAALKPGRRDAAPRIAAARAGLAEVHLRQGDHAAAIAEAERALDTAGSLPLHARVRGRAHALLARAHHRAGNRAAALKHGRSARAELASAPPVAAAELRAAKLWLRRVGGVR